MPAPSDPSQVSDILDLFESPKFLLGLLVTEMMTMTLVFAYLGGLSLDRGSNLVLAVMSSNQFGTLSATLIFWTIVHYILIIAITANLVVALVVSWSKRSGMTYRQSIGLYSEGKDN